MSSSACTDADVDAAPDSGSGGLNCIEHYVSKMDTLAGVAIKYGVEVADIKRMNGLATDLQMFALKKLHIPLPGRHPPSSCLSGSGSLRGGTAGMPPRLGHSMTVESFQPLKVKSPPKETSVAMNMLQNYYGLITNHTQAAEGTEMVPYRTEKSRPSGNGSLPKPSPISDSHLPHPHRHGNMANNIMLENGATSEESVWRRQKAKTGSVSATPEKLLRKEGSSGFSAITGKGLAQRPKSGSRTSLVIDPETGFFSSVQVGVGDSTAADGFTGVRKSPSTPALQEHDTNNSSGWPTSKWHLKSDLQALSSAAIARPLFDGLWNKAARD